MGIGNLKLNRWGNLIVVAIFVGGWWTIHTFDWAKEILLNFATGLYFWPLLFVTFAIFGYLDWHNKGGHSGEEGGGCGGSCGGAQDPEMPKNHTCNHELNKGSMKLRCASYYRYLFDNL